MVSAYKKFLDALHPFLSLEIQMILQIVLNNRLALKNSTEKQQNYHQGS